MWWEYLKSVHVSGTVTAIIAFCGVYIAWRGLQTWREQLKGTSDYQLAKDTLKAAFDVRDAFARVRNQATYAYEYPEEMLDINGNLKKECKAKATQFVYENRLKKLSEAFCSLEARSLDAQVAWGKRFEHAMIPIRKCRADLLVALQDHIRELDPAMQHLVRPDRSIEIMYIMYDNCDTEHPDEFTCKINSAILVFEEPLRQIINK